MQYKLNYFVLARTWGVGEKLRILMVVRIGSWNTIPEQLCESMHLNKVSNIYIS